MLNNQQPMQAMRGNQPAATNQLAVSSKPEEGHQSFEAKLSERIDAGDDDKKLTKPTDKPETAQAAPTPSQNTVVPLPTQASSRELVGQLSETNQLLASLKDSTLKDQSIKDATVTSSVSLASRQQGDLLRLARARADSGRASFNENGFEMKSSKLGSAEGSDAKLLSGSISTASPLGALAGNGGVGVPTVALSLVTLGPELSTKNSPTAFEVYLSTPLGDPHFESSFANQISFLTNQGITHAKIHLNPEEMGPVSVDIHSVGDKIEVNFQAAREQTRQAIEASIDTLRGLMRDEGMSLQNAVVRSIEVTPPQAMSASSEQRSNDFQFDRASQFDGFEKNFHQNSRDHRQPDNQLFTEPSRTNGRLVEPSVGRNGAMMTGRLAGIDLFA
jgi:hypothetical protein